MNNTAKQLSSSLSNLLNMEGFSGNIPGFFKLMMDNVPDLIWAKNMKGEYLFANRAICSLLLKSDNPDRVIGKTDAFFAQKEREAGYEHTFGEICMDSDEVVNKSGQPERFIEDGLVRGEYLILDIVKAPFFDENGEVVGTVGCGRNITKEKDIGDKLFQSRQQFISVLNNLTTLVYVVDPVTHELLFVNETLARRFAKRPYEFLGKICWQELFKKQDGPCEICSLCEGSQSDMSFDFDGPVSKEIKNLYVNRTFDLSEQLINWTDGRQVKLTILTDITDRKRIEDEKVDALKFAAEQEKYALVGQVAGKMAHDFNNILGGIMGNAELSLLECQEEETLESLNVILEQTIRGKNLTQNLVAFAKDHEPKEEFFDINSKIDLVVNLLRKDLEYIEVEKDCASDLPDILADPGMIEHALINLIQNSIHATSQTDSPHLTLKTYDNAGQLFVEVVDNGCGIPEAYHDDIYSPSFTLKGSKDVLKVYKKGIKGTGYGMANVKKYIEKHKGTVSFESTENKGTKFVLSIPIIHKDLTEKEKQILSKKKIVSQMKILLVEDEPAIAKVQRAILENPPFSHTVTLAENAVQAMETFDENSFDLVSLDYLLPGDLNGLDVYNHIRHKDENIPVVFVSGNMGFLESIEQLTTTDKNLGHVSKPCENIVYADLINQWLSRI